MCTSLSLFLSSLSLSPSLPLSLSLFSLSLSPQVEKVGGNEAAKMQSALQDLLRSNEIPSKVLTPVYNPRIALGKLNPAKCRIMASKKVSH